MMSDIAIRVEDVSKRYKIGTRKYRHDTLREQVIDSVKSILSRNRHQAERATIWALKNVSFEVRAGENVGIIGRNGSGKSTLLKILSRITDPTSGRAQLHGRVASLLEVGTGFDRDLTGRENIYLSGAILGMRKAEIDRKFDEIVAFSEVETFIDTPVKRYSSGMYVRLAFAVAAYLESEILIVDEVLAVGDAAFQQKCLGRMDAVRTAGRTILFVSHNLTMVQKLCSRAILLNRGHIEEEGDTQSVIDTYAKIGSSPSKVSIGERTDRVGQRQVLTTAFELLDGGGFPITSAVSGRETVMRLHYKCEANKVFPRCLVSVSVHRRDGQPYFVLSTDLVQTQRLDLHGEGYIDFFISEWPLSGGIYYLHTYIESDKVIQDWLENATQLSVVDGDFYGTGKLYHPGWQGACVLVRHDWRLTETNPFCAKGKENVR